MSGGHLILSPADLRGSDRTRWRDHERLARALAGQVLRRDMRRWTFARAGAVTGDTLVDGLVAGPGEPATPHEVFHHLRWGGTFAYLDTDEAQVQRVAAGFDNRGGFVLERRPTYLWAAPFGLRLPPLAVRGHYFLARKTQLIEPGEFTERFTYHVELAADPDAEHGYVVSKQVPTKDHVLWRLEQKFPDADRHDLERRAHKLVDHVFPTFLTRETAILKILHKALPEAYRNRFPRVLGVEQDPHGFVHTLRMTWLRNGGPTLSQLEFARQSAELLSVLHDHAGVIHLDLRLDNFVITERGVGFVDFGSAVRMGEKLEQSPMLNTLFSEMMRTSQIQRMLGRMLEKGQVTSRMLREVHGKVDKAVDTFYLAVQINRPHRNPELRHLVRFDPGSREAKQLEALTAAILRPKHPEKSDFKTAADILRGIRRIEQRLTTREAA